MSSNESKLKVFVEFLWQHKESLVNAITVIYLAGQAAGFWSW